MTFFANILIIERTPSRRGATYTVDKDGNPVRHRYRPRTEADDAIRLPPVVVGTRVAAPVVKQTSRDRRVKAVSDADMYHKDTTVKISQVVYKKE